MAWFWLHKRFWLSWLYVDVLLKVINYHYVYCDNFFFLSSNAALKIIIVTKYLATALALFSTLGYLVFAANIIANLGSVWFLFLFLFSILIYFFHYQ